jgi:hypothetical protein
MAPGNKIKHIKIKNEDDKSQILFKRDVGSKANPFPSG